MKNGSDVFLEIFSGYVIYTILTGF